MTGGGTASGQSSEGSGGHSQPEPLEDKKQLGEEPKESDRDAGRFRRGAGYLAAAIAVVTIFGTFYISVYSLDDIRSTGNVVFDGIKLGAHALIVVSFIFFDYQLLKMAERFCLPHFVIRNAGAHQVLGLPSADTPFEQLQRSGSAAVNAAADAAKTVRGAIAGEKHEPKP